MHYWLMKSEPSSYSIDDLQYDSKTQWEGVRNYQARNFMRDDMQIGDLALFYHSNAKPPGVVGVMRVCSKPYPDQFSWNPDSKYFDPKSTPDNPRWFMVDLEFVEKFPQIMTLDEIKSTQELDGILVAKRGMRLSIQPVGKKHFDWICNFARR